MNRFSKSRTHGGTHTSSLDDNNVNPESGNDNDNHLDFPSGKGSGRNINSTKISDSHSDDDESSVPDLSDALRKHREMIREMKRKHRVSAKTLRRVRRRDLHRHQIQQHTYHDFLNDTLTNCSESFVSESLYTESLCTALDNLSVATPNFSFSLPDSPSLRSGISRSGISRSGMSLTPSPSFPRTIDESYSSTEQERSWKQENIATLSTEYNDDDFTRLFRRDKKKPRPSRTPGRRKKTKALAGVSEELGDDIGKELEDDENDDVFFDSLEVHEHDEQAFVDEFFDCDPTPEKHDLSVKSMPFEKNNSENAVCTLRVLESTGEESNTDIAESFSDVQRINRDSGNDILQSNKGHSASTENIGLRASPSVIENENDEDEDDDFVDSFSDAQSPQQIMASSIFQNTDNQPSIIQSYEEDRSELINDFSKKLEAIDITEEAIMNVRNPFFTRNDEEKENDESVDMLFGDKFSEQNICKQSFRDGIEDISFIEKIDMNRSGSFVDNFTVSQAKYIEKAHLKNMIGLPVIEKLEKEDNNIVIQNLGETRRKHNLDEQNIAQTPTIAFVDIHSNAQSTQPSIENIIQPSHIEEPQKNKHHHIDDKQSQVDTPWQDINESQESVLNIPFITQEGIESRSTSSLNPILSKSINDDISAQSKELNTAAFVFGSTRGPSRDTQTAIKPTQDELRTDSPTRKINRIEKDRKECRKHLDLNTKRVENEDDEINTELLAEEDKKKIDDILEGFFEEMGSIESDSFSNDSKPKSDERNEKDSETDIDDFNKCEENPNAEIDDNSRLNIVEQPRFEDTESQELTIEPIQDFDQNPISISMFLQHELDVEVNEGSDKIEMEEVSKDEVKEIDDTLDIPSPIKEEVKEIDDMLDDFLRSMAATDHCGDDNEDLNCTEDYNLGSPQKIHIESPTFISKVAEGINKSSQNEEILSGDRYSNYELSDECFVLDGIKCDSLVEPDSILRTQLCDTWNDGTNSLQAEVLISDHEKVHSPMHKVQGSISTVPLINAESQCSEKSPTLLQTPLRHCHIESKDTSKYTMNENTIIIEDAPSIKHCAELEAKLSRSSLDSKVSNSRKKMDFFPPSLTPPDGSKSRITSPELNQSFRDNPDIFLSTTAGDDSERPVDPVARALSIDLLVDKIDAAGNNTQNPSTTSNSINNSLQSISPVVFSQALSEDSRRPIYPIPRALSRDSFEDRTIEKTLQKRSNASESKNESIESIGPIAFLESISDDSRSNDPIASKLAQDMPENDMHARESKNESIESISPVTLLQSISDDSRPNDPVASKLAQDSSGNDMHAIEKSYDKISSNSGFARISNIVADSGTITERIIDDPTRPDNPVATTLSRDNSEGETKSIENINKNVQSISDGPKYTSKAIHQVEQPKAIKKEPANNYASTKPSLVLEFGSKTIQITDDPARPDNPVATTLSRDNSEGETQGYKMSDQNIQSTYDSSKDTRKAIHPVEQHQDIGNELATNEASTMFSNVLDSTGTNKRVIDNSSRPDNPVATILSRDNSEGETHGSKMSDQNIQSSYDSSKDTSKATHRVEHPKAMRKEPANNEASKKQPQVLDSASTTTQIIDDLARPDNPVATTLSRDNSEGEAQSFEKSYDCTNNSSTVIHPVEQPKAIRKEPANNGAKIASQNDLTKKLPLFEQGSVSTISASSLPSPKAERVDASQLEIPVPLSYSLDSDESPRRNPRRVPVKQSIPDDPEKCFHSIATPSPIRKKESKLTKSAEGSAKRIPRRPQSASPIGSDSAKGVFQRTTERLSEGSLSQQRRARFRKPASPHRVVTSRSPLFFERGQGRSSTIGDSSTVSWITSPGRFRGSTTSHSIQNNNHRDRFCARSLPPSSSQRKKGTKRSPVRSETTQSTMVTYASPNRSMVSSMKSPLRGFHSLASPPRSPAVSLFSRMPRGARSAIRRMQKHTKDEDGNDGDDETHQDLLSVDTVRVCTNKFAYKIHPKMGPCDRCWALASEKEREIFLSRGSHLRIAKTRSGCQRSCAIFPPEDKDRTPVRLCRPCFFATHQHGDGSSRLHVYKGNHVKVRPLR